MLRTALLLTMLASTTALAATPSYTTTKIAPLGAPDRWDYVSYDAPSHRVFVAHMDHIDVVDAASGVVLGRLEGVHGAHGQAVAADGAIWADSGKTAQVTQYDPKDFRAKATLPAGVDADAVVAAPGGKIVAVMNGDGESVTIVDTTQAAVRFNVKLGGSPEFAAADGAGHLYINIASTKEIVAVDTKAGQVTARYAVPGCTSPHGLAMDTGTRRLFVSCVNAVLQVLDADNGQVLQSLPIGQGTDAAAFDPGRRLVFSSNGDGTLSVFHEDAAGKLAPLGAVKTLPGARTMAVDPVSGRVFLVTAELAGTQPAAEGGRVHYQFKPGSVKLLFLDPAAP